MPWVSRVGFCGLPSATGALSVESGPSACPQPLRLHICQDSGHCGLYLLWDCQGCQGSIDPQSFQEIQATVPSSTSVTPHPVWADRHSQSQGQQRQPKGSFATSQHLMTATAPRIPPPDPVRSIAACSPASTPAAAQPCPKLHVALPCGPRRPTATAHPLAPKEPPPH